MKFNNWILALSVCLLFGVASAFAQHRGGHGKKHRINPIEKYKSELNLTSEQETQIDAIQAKYKTEFENLRNLEVEDHTEKRAQMHELKEALRAELEAVLTDEQEAILKEKMEADRAERKAMWDKVDKEGLKSEMKAYHEENILPVMRAQRAKLEPQISADDKETIAELRTTFEAIKAQHQKSRMQEDGPPHKGQFKGFREAHKAEIETLNDLVQKYQEPIQALFAEVEDQQKEWKEGKRAIMEKYMPERPDRGERPERGQGHHKGRKGSHGPKGEMKHMGRFLLLDINAAPTTTSPENISISMKNFPNPTSGINTLEYTLENAGNVTIELRDKTGNLIKTLFNGNKAAGTHNLPTDLSTVQDGIYYYVITDQKGSVSQKVVVSRQ